jgi:hypothetical protein
MRNDLPSDKASNFNARLRETMMTYLGKQGDPLDRGITLRDLVESGFVKLTGGRIGGGPVPLLPGDVIGESTEPDFTPPPTPTGFVATAGIATVTIEHDAPNYPQGRGHLRTRVYGVIVSAGDPLPTFDDAVEIAQFSGRVFAYATNPSTTWRLWIKWETVDNVLGQPAGGTNGLAVTTGQDVSLLLEALTGEITESQLFADLGARINLIDGPTTLAGSVAARILTETQARLAADTALGSSITTLQNTDATQATQITTLQTRATSSESNIITLQNTTASQASSITSLTTRTTAAESNITSLQTTTANQATQLNTLSTTVGNNTTAIQTEATTRASVDTGLLAQYTVKADVNGYVSGFGLASTANNSTPFSSFIVRADSFSIANPAGPGIAPALPFIVRTTPTTIGGVSVPVGVYITDGFIQNGTISTAKIANAAIDDAKIANLSAAKITSGTIDADRLDANTITSKVLSVDWAKITNANVTNAQIANGAITTAKITDGTITDAKIANTIQSTNFGATAGWQINKAGTATFNQVELRGRLTVDCVGGNVQLGNDVGPNPGHFGLSLSHTDFNNIFFRRNDGVTFFRVNDGGANSLTFDSASGVLNLKGVLSAATGTFSGSLTAQAINAVNTINIAGNAVTVPVSAFTAGSVALSQAFVWETVQSVSITTSGSRVFVATAGTALSVSFGDGSTAIPIFRITRNGVELMRGGREAIALSYSDTPAAGTYTYALQMFSSDAGFNFGAGPIANNRSIFVIETKR